MNATTWPRWSITRSTSSPARRHPAACPIGTNPAVILMNQVVERMADLAASYAVAGFVHGVLNTDNMNVSGESFDYGPWRWLPTWDAGFTAAYFDHAGLYAFGRQAEAIHWNCAQLAIALRAVCDAPPLIAALERFGPLYAAAMARRWTWRLGVASRGAERDAAMIAACERAMQQSGMGPDAFFHRHRGGANADGELAEALSGYEADRTREPRLLARRPGPVDVDGRGGGDLVRHRRTGRLVALAGEGGCSARSGRCARTSARASRA